MVIVPVWSGCSLVELLKDTDFLLCPSRNGTVLNSKVLSVTIKPTPASLTAPVVVEFSHLYNVSLPFSPTNIQISRNYGVYFNMSIFLFPYLRAQPIRPAYRGMRATGKIGQSIYDNTATCNLYCIIIGICNSSLQCWFQWMKTSWSLEKSN